MMTRREFLEDMMLTTAAAAAAVASPSFAQQKEPTSPNESISVAIIGCGIRGRQHVQELRRVGGCHIACVCDPDSERVEQLANETEKQQGRAPKAVRDMRRIFDDASVDAVFIATCNHWHALAAIWAMQAGKHVYLEKPVSHNVSEGRRIVQVARKTGRLCQSGTQRRSSGVAPAARLPPRWHTSVREN